MTEIKHFPSLKPCKSNELNLKLTKYFKGKCIVCDIV